jgi:hypothetical protein
VWDFATAKIVAEDKVNRAMPKVKGQESALWGVDIDPKFNYHIIPSCSKKSAFGPFVLRVFSPDYITVEKVDPVVRKTINSSWRRTPEVDTAGGPPLVLDKESGVKKTSHRWCQNPQFHIDLLDKFSKSDLHLKIVLRRTDKPAKTVKGNLPETVSFVVCKAECLEDQSPLRKKGGKPRQNALGEAIPAKESSLRRKTRLEELPPTHAARDSGKTILRRTNVPKDSFALFTTGKGRMEASAYFPLLPRSWLSNGLIVVPSISVVGTKGNFDIEVFSSEPMEVNQMPEQYMKTVASEFTEVLCGGSHICENFKKNPRFILKLHTVDPTRAAVKLRITLTRVGDSWISAQRSDAVGSMIGFYVFRASMGSMEMVYEGNFVPDKEVSTDGSFMLEPLPDDEDYIIVPATFGEGKLGAFVVGIMCDCEVMLARADAGK